MPGEWQAQSWRLVGWEINVPFQTKIDYIGEKVLGRFSSARLWMATERYSNLPTSLPFSFSDYPKWERIWEVHLSYYASAYNKVENNQKTQDQFISTVQCDDILCN